MKAEILLGKGIEEGKKNRENTADQEKSWCKVTPVECAQEEVILTGCSRASSHRFALKLTSQYPSFCGVLTCLYINAVNDRGIICDYTKYAIFITMHSIINLRCHRM